MANALFVPTELASNSISLCSLTSMRICLEIMSSEDSFKKFLLEKTNQKTFFKKKKFYEQK